MSDESSIPDREALEALITAAVQSAMAEQIPPLIEHATDQGFAAGIEAAARALERMGLPVVAAQLRAALVVTS